MTAALLCPGPSLAQTFDDDFAGPRVGVNRAATAFRCDVWAALDYPLTRDNHEAVIGTPKWFTRRQTAADIGQRVRFRDVLIAEDLVCPVHHWDRFTATCALVLLAGMGASEVKVYGADWKPGALDWDGAGNGEDRTADRFGIEKEIWARLLGWMAGRGISVERVRP